MKKWIICLLAVSMLSMTACGGLVSALLDEDNYEEVDAEDDDADADEEYDDDRDADDEYDDEDYNDDDYYDADDSGSGKFMPSRGDGEDDDYDEYDDDYGYDDDPDQDSGQDSEIMDFTAADLNQKNVRLGDIIGSNKVTLINYWGTFCGPCINEMPDLAKLEKKYKKKGFEIVGMTCDIVNPDDSIDQNTLSDAKDIIASTGVDYPVLIATNEINEYFDAEYVPMSFFVDSHGNQISDVIVGSQSLNEWESMITDLID
ncbi:MAG: TlpA family protein disulfide reductase [Lachnospiraceae bacterium]|nr:TlpA family protein disulfide reductase [Lachnospiraceae bacterium]